MFDVFPPFLIFVIGALLLPLLPAGLPRALVCVVVPVISASMIWEVPQGMFAQVSLAGFDLTLMRSDKLAIVFGLVFSFAAFVSMVYAWHVRDLLQQVSALLYAGSAIGAVFAGDLISLFIFWEGTAVTSVFLIWARRTNGAFATGMRYLVIQIASGVLLLGGIALLYRETGSLAFDVMTLESAATWLIFIAFGIKCAFPLLHNWLPDSYPAATVTGTVILSAFTTKLAVYALARGFPGTEILIYIGAVMAVFTIFYALMENDLRRVLSYALNNQLGFMVVGVGVGTELALNGVAAHAFSHILYKSLLFMAVGAVLYRTGTAKCSELGGLYRTMPLTLLLCLVGGASLSGPLFAGFVSKSLILSGTASAGHYVAWGALLFASAGVFLVCALKVPYFTFFGKDSGLRPKEAPSNMLLAMATVAVMCIIVGVYPDVLYSLLPHDVNYEPYTTTHVITQLQLLFFSALAFVVLLRTGLYPLERKSIHLDADWIYRKVLPGVVRRSSYMVFNIMEYGSWFVMRKINLLIRTLYSSHGPEGRMATVWPTGAMVMWIGIILGATLIVNFV